MSFAIGLAVLAIIVVIAAGVAVKSLWSGTATFTVTDKAVKRSGSGSDSSDQYLIFTDHGTFKDVDAVLFWKFDSSDLYGKLQIGHTYKCRTFGYRFAFASQYKNLIDCDEVTK